MFQDVIADTSQTHIDTITCEGPTFTDFYNTTNVPCAVIDHDTIYANDVFVLWSFDANFFDANTTNTWDASVPNGWLTYAGDSLSVLGSKAVALFLLVLLPFSLPSVVAGLTFLWAIQIPLFIMLGFGIYKGVDPFG